MGMDKPYVLWQGKVEFLRNSHDEPVMVTARIVISVRSYFSYEILGRDQLGNEAWELNSDPGFALKVIQKYVRGAINGV